jgi:hypothetical protein
MRQLQLHRNAGKLGNTGKLGNSRSLRTVGIRQPLVEPLA